MKISKWAGSKRGWVTSTELTKSEGFFIDSSSMVLPSWGLITVKSNQYRTVRLQ